MELNAMIFIGMLILFMFFIVMSVKSGKKIHNLFAIGVLVMTYFKFKTDIGSFAVLFVLLILWLIYDIFKGGEIA